jgi:hypothetical protein
VIVFELNISNYAINETAMCIGLMQRPEFPLRKKEITGKISISARGFSQKLPP